MHFQEVTFKYLAVAHTPHYSLTSACCI